MLEFLDDEHCVVAAKAKGIVKTDLYLGGAGFVGDVVQVAFWVGGFVIDGGWHDLILDSHGAKDGFDGASRPHDMPRH